MPLDRAPRDITAEQDAGVSGASAPSGGGSGTGQRIFFASTDPQTGAVRLQQVSRDVPTTANDVLSALFKGVTDTERAERKLTTQIPLDTKLISVSLLGDSTMVINVDSTIFQARASNLTVAVAQIVYTATALAGVDRVRLLVDGKPQSWTWGDGRQHSGDLTPLAYPAYYPASQPNLPPVPSPTGPTTTTTTIAPTTTTSTVPVTSTGPPARPGPPPQPPPAATTTSIDAPADEPTTTTTDGS